MTRTFCAGLFLKGLCDVLVSFDDQIVHHQSIEHPVGTRRIIVDGQFAWQAMQHERNAYSLDTAALSILFCHSASPMTRFCLRSLLCVTHPKRNAELSSAHKEDIRSDRRDYSNTSAAARPSPLPSSSSSESARGVPRLANPDCWREVHG